MTRKVKLLYDVAVVKDHGHDWAVEALMPNKLRIVRPGALEVIVTKAAIVKTGDTIYCGKHAFEVLNHGISTTTNLIALEDSAPDDYAHHLRAQADTAAADLLLARDALDNAKTPHELLYFEGPAIQPSAKAISKAEARLTEAQERHDAAMRRIGSLSNAIEWGLA